jgi:hypothetical protein
MGDHRYRRYIPQLLETARAGGVSPELAPNEERPFADVIGAYRRVDPREAGWLKVALTTQSARRQQRQAP